MSAQFLNQMPYQELPKKTDSLTIWLFIAAVIHAIVLMGLGFENPKPQIISKSIEVTIVNSSAKKAPENAKYFAQANQIAAGSEQQKPQPIEKKKPQAGHDQKKQKRVKSSKAQTQIEHRLITQKQAEKKLESAQKQEENQEDDKNTQAQPELSVEELDKQIALLELKLKKQQENSEKTNIKSINGISAHKYIAAQYIKQWENKVQRNGNLNLPEINGTQSFSGTLVMDVGVETDGSLYNTVIVKSSGIAALDKAAKQIVKMSAPFTPLPKEVAEQLDVLRIRREWVFSNGETVSTSSYLTPIE